MAGLTKQQKKSLSDRISQLSASLAEFGCTFVPGGKPTAQVHALELQLKLRQDTTMPECKICGYKNSSIFQHLTNNHKLSKEEYVKLFGDSNLVSEAESERLGEKIRGNKNPAAGHGGKYSVFSKNNANFSEDKKAEAFSKIKETKSKTNNDNTKLSYYTARGYSEEDARLALSERQSTFSLDKCILRYGQEEGERVFKARQDKWLNTLNSKPAEELARIQKAKMCKGYTISKTEMRVLNELTSHGLVDEHQFVLRNEQGRRHYIYDIRVGNHLIEVNGDYWHANPRRYNAGDKIKFRGRGYVCVEDIWTRDIAKTNYAEDAGYTVHAVWESDIKNNFKETMEQLIEKLK